jgi:hypothetical protein
VDGEPNFITFPVLRAIVLIVFLAVADEDLSAIALRRQMS